VYYIPWLTTNILSIGQLDEAWCKVDIYGGVLKIHEPGGQLLAMLQRGENRLYVLHLNIAQMGCLLLRGEEDSWHWHARLGHINMAVIRKMVREELVRGLPNAGEVGSFYDACQVGKQKCTPFPSQGSSRLSEC
jgi:hypothetical protein